MSYESICYLRENYSGGSNRWTLYCVPFLTIMIIGRTVSFHFFFGKTCVKSNLHNVILCLGREGQFTIHVEIRADETTSVHVSEGLDEVRLEQASLQGISLCCYILNPI